MKTLGVCYDAGVVKDIPWRPNLDARTARREMEIIRHDLHCTAVRVVGRDVGRLEMATEAALGAGLGALLGYFGQCSSGTCPLISTWWRGAIYGGFLGLLMALSTRTP